MSEFESLDQDDVVSMNEAFLIANSTFLTKEFMAKLKTVLLEATKSNYARAVCEDGVRCRVLRPDTGWRFGKLVLRLEFCSDEPEVKKVVDAPNVLDEYRQ